MLHAHLDIPRLWNQLPDSFPEPHQSCQESPPHASVNSNHPSHRYHSQHPLLPITLSLQPQNLPFPQILPT